MNRLKPLKLGYVLVKNRSQEEISEGSSLASARSSERNFFSSHEVMFSVLNLDVSGSRTISLRADIATGATAGNVNAFNLVSINGEALASPIKGNSMNIGGATVGDITVAKVGSQPSNPTVG